jgi:hypothetical protein
MKKTTFCVFCRTKKFVYTKKHTSFINWVLSSFCSVVMSFILFQDLDLKSLIFLGLFIALAEIFIHLRWRLSVVCHECGFDPIIYLQNSEQAMIKVKDKLEKRKQDPRNYLKPPLDIPVRILHSEKGEAIVSSRSLDPKKRQILRDYHLNKTLMKTPKDPVL